MCIGYKYFWQVEPDAFATGQGGKPEKFYKPQKKELQRETCQKTLLQLLFQFANNIKQTQNNGLYLSALYYYAVSSNMAEEAK